MSFSVGFTLERWVGEEADVGQVDLWDEGCFRGASSMSEVLVRFDALPGSEMLHEGASAWERFPVVLRATLGVAGAMCEVFERLASLSNVRFVVREAVRGRLSEGPRLVVEVLMEIVGSSRSASCCLFSRIFREGLVARFGRVETGGDDIARAGFGLELVAGVDRAECVFLNGVRVLGENDCCRFETEGCASLSNGMRSACRSAKLS